MTLTPEQFNKIALKEDTDRIEKKVDKISANVSKLLTAVDGLTKKVDDVEHAFVSNQAAHDRFEQRISIIEQHLGLKVVISAK